MDDAHESLTRAQLGRLLADLGYPPELRGPATPLVALRTNAPVQYCMFLLALEADLGSPFPEDLLDVLETLDDLRAFAEVKAHHHR